MVSTTIGAVNVANVVSIFFAALRATMPETCSARVCSKVAANIRRLEVGHHLVAGGVS